MKKQIKVEMVMNLNCTQKEYEELLRILDHHVEYLIDMDEYPEIESISNVFVREEKGL